MAILSPSGLCLVCAGTDQTAEPTPLEPPPLNPSPTAPTATAWPESATATACEILSRAAMPLAPPGYELLDRLGSGGMGSVYLAREQASDRLVAMKFLHHPGDQGSFDRFLVELRVLAQLDHPNIVRVLGSDFLRADPFFTMEHMAGGSLSRVLDAGEPTPVAEIVVLMRAVAEAVAAAHAKGVIHRDLKPSNILLGSDGTPKVSDFGLAKRLEQDDQLTPASGALGTASYMPPEQVSRRNGDIGPWSDVYGLGATLYHLLTGRAPFLGDTIGETIIQVLTEMPARPRAIRADIPAALEGIVVKCLEKDPKDRYQTAAELAADLDRFLAGQKPIAPPLTLARRARGWVSRNRRGLAVAVLLAGAFALGAAYWPRTEPLPEVVKPPETKPVAPADEPNKKPDEKRPDPRELIRREVLAGGDVVLVPEKGMPRWSEWLYGKAELGESPVGDGACYFQAAGGLSLLQLFDPPQERYRLSLQIQQVGVEHDSGSPSIGLFLGHTTFERGDNPPARGLLLLDFLDFDTEVYAGRPPADRVLRFGWSHLVPPPGGLPSPHHTTFKSDKFRSQISLPGPWWSLVADVSPESLVIRCSRGGAPMKVLANLSREEIRKYLLLYRTSQVQAVRNAGGKVDFGPLPNDWNLVGGAGVWCSRSRVAFKNVVVSPLP